MQKIEQKIENKGGELVLRARERAYTHTQRGDESDDTRTRVFFHARIAGSGV